MAQQVSGGPNGIEALRNAFGSRLEHKNNASVDTTGETVTFTRAAGYLLIHVTVNNLLISFDEGATFFTLTTARGYQEFFGHFPSIFVKAATATANYEIVG